MFVDTGVPAFFNEFYAHGGMRARMDVARPAAANVQTGGEDRFAIGKRNYLTLRKILWKNGILIKAEDVGGAVPRTMYLEVATGHVWLSIGGNQVDLVGGSTSFPARARLAVWT